MKLENWSVTSNADAWTPPELITTRLQGTVYGHLHHQDGKFIITSPVEGKVKDLIYTVSGSIYELGQPAEDYEKEFPNAKERVLRAIRELSPTNT